MSGSAGETRHLRLHPQCRIRSRWMRRFSTRMADPPQGSAISAGTRPGERVPPEVFCGRSAGGGFDLAACASAAMTRSVEGGHRGDVGVR